MLDTPTFLAENAWMLSPQRSIESDTLLGSCVSLFYRSHALMVRFNTTFLLQATTLLAVCCIPMALSQENGFVWTAFLAPLCLGVLVAAHIQSEGEYRVWLEQRSDTVVEVRVRGGRVTQWLSRARTILIGLSVSIVVGPPALHTVDPGPEKIIVFVSVAYALIALALAGYSERRLVLTEDRLFVNEMRLFGCCFFRSRYQAREGDALRLLTSGAKPGAKSLGHGMPYCHLLYVDRPGRWRRYLLYKYEHSTVDPELAAVGERVGSLLGLPFKGYVESTDADEPEHRRLGD